MCEGRVLKDGIMTCTEIDEDEKALGSIQNKTVQHHIETRAGDSMVFSRIRYDEISRGNYELC